MRRAIALADDTCAPARRAVRRGRRAGPRLVAEGRTWSRRRTTRPPAPRSSPIRKFCRALVTFRLTGCECPWELRALSDVPRRRLLGAARPPVVRGGPPGRRARRLRRRPHLWRFRASAWPRMRPNRTPCSRTEEPSRCSRPVARDTGPGVLVHASDPALCPARASARILGQNGAEARCRICCAPITVPMTRMPTLHDFSAKTIDGTAQSLRDYAGKVALVVNVASQCGLTPQYAGLEELYGQLQGSRAGRCSGFRATSSAGRSPGRKARSRCFARRSSE